MRSSALRIAAVLALLPAPAGCGDLSFVLTDPPAPVVEDPPPPPTACEEAAEAAAPVTTPSPVRLLLLFDLSGSMQFTDQPGARFAAARAFLDSLQDRPEVSVASMGFGARIYVEPPIVDARTDPLFIPAADWQLPAFYERLEVATDFEGGLSAASQHIAADMVRLPDTARAVTHWVVLFFTDGVPSPSCCSEAAEVIGDLAASDPTGCAPEPWETAAADAQLCDAEVELGLCDDAEILASFRSGVADDPTPSPDYGDGPLVPFAGLTPNGDYNRLENLLQRVRDLVALSDLHEAGPVTLNISLLNDPTLPDEVKDALGLNGCRLQRTADALAVAGDAASFTFLRATDISFASVATAPVCEAP